MDAIDNQLGAAEKRCTRNVNNDYDCNYLDNRSNDDNNNDGQGELFETAAGGEQQRLLPLVKLCVAIAVKASGSGGGVCPHAMVIHRWTAKAVDDAPFLWRR